MKTWRKIATVVIIILSTFYTILGVLFLINSEGWESNFMGFFCILMIGFGLPYGWLLECLHAKEKGEL